MWRLHMWHVPGLSELENKLVGVLTLLLVTYTHKFSKPILLDSALYG